MDRRTLLKAGLLTPAALALPVAGGVAEARPRITRVLASGLDVPWNIAFLPSGDALVSERDTGRIIRVGAGGGQHAVGHVPGVVPNVAQGGEGGLLGLALHPGFARNRWVYAYLSSRTDNRVVRMRYVDGKLGRPHVLLKGIAKSIHHNGGGLAFGPGGMLYVSTGDAENPDNAQRKTSRSGKILRMAPDGSIPAGNPFGTRVWSYGHRNPEGIAFAADGTLWSSELGQDSWDELNLIHRGHNYGWPRQEGKDGPGGFHDPLAQWNPDNCSPSGIAIAHGRAWLGALRGQCLWSVRLHGPHRGRKVRHLHDQLGRIRAVAKAPDGSLWVGTSNRDGRATPGPDDDQIFRVALG